MRIALDSMSIENTHSVLLDYPATVIILNVSATVVHI